MAIVSINPIIFYFLHVLRDEFALKFSKHPCGNGRSRLPHQLQIHMQVMPRQQPVSEDLVAPHQVRPYFHRFPPTGCLL
jgi:hypothetical protein